MFRVRLTVMVMVIAMVSVRVKVTFKISFKRRDWIQINVHNSTAYPN
jgi:hypothetical protein